MCGIEGFGLEFGRRARAFLTDRFELMVACGTVGLM